MGVNKLLIVDNTEFSVNFVNNFKSKNYTGWKIFITGNKLPLENAEYSKLRVEELLEQQKNNYKVFLIIKSSDTLINSYKLDLVQDVLEFPTVDEDGALDSKENKNNLITLGNDFYYKLIKTSVLQKENWKLKSLTYQYVNYLFIQKSKYNYEIDYVFPYVNSSDPEWIKNYLKYKNMEESRIESDNSKDPRYESHYSTGLQRFRDSGLMKYVFRSIEKNLPFIRKVHMVVASESQVPSWVNKSTVDIITHDEFMPKELLPTFSSSEIEMFLPKLPRVSEYFIYGNDDEYIMNPQKLQNWFFDGKPVSYATIRNMVDTYTGDIFRRNDLMLVAPKNTFLGTNVCLGEQHCPQPYVLSKMKECYEKYEKQILSSCTRFREDKKNFNQWIFLGYNYFNHFMYLKKRLCLTTEINKMDNTLDVKKYTCVCMNDSSENLDIQNLEVFKKQMDILFPNKSKYEL